MTVALEQALGLHRAGRLNEALTAYQCMLAAKPEDPEVLHLTGVLAHQMGKTPFGIALIMRAIEWRPEAAVYHKNLAELHKACGDIAAACEALTSAAALSPNDATVHNDLGLLRAALGDDVGALASYRAAISIAPDDPNAHNNMGVLLQERGEEAAAMRAFDAAIAASPTFAAAHNNRGTLLWSCERIDEAVDALETAMAADPAHAGASVNLGQLSLHRGDLAKGWALLEARHQVANAVRLPGDLPVWDGKSDPGRRLLVAAEQGVGDELLFASCIPDLIDRWQRTTIVLECDPRLAHLFVRSFPTCEVRPNRVTSDGQIRLSHRPWLAQVSVDSVIAAGSLPGLCRPSIDAFPSAPSYLIADPAKVDHWRAWRDAQAPGEAQALVGFCWRSGVSDGVRAKLACPLSAWLPLLQRPGLRFVNLQYGEAAEELSRFAADNAVDMIDPADLDVFEDLNGLAAMLTCLDALVAGPTAVCELAGGLGVPAIRVVRGVDWSNLGVTDRRPWHPNTRLANASAYAAPDQLVGRVTCQLDEILTSRGV